LVALLAKNERIHDQKHVLWKNYINYNNFCPKKSNFCPKPFSGKAEGKHLLHLLPFQTLDNQSNENWEQMEQMFCKLYDNKSLLVL